MRKFAGKIDGPVGLVLGLGTLLRLRAVPERLGDLDAVNFARGLVVFDPASQAPHFPGYPVLMACARIAAALGARDPVLALSLPGLLLWPLAGALLFHGLRARLDRMHALAALSFASLSPGVVLNSAWPGSEGLGFALLCASVGGLLSHSGRLQRVGALCLGLMLGVRLSWWPIALGVVGACMLCDASRRARTLGHTALGVCLWLVPMLVLLRDDKLFALAVSFVHGHFFDWGATALSGSQSLPSSLVTRGVALVQGVWSAGFGAASWGTAGSGLWAASSIALAAGLGGALLLAAMRRTLGPQARSLRLALACAAPYLAWLLLAQNVDKSRHLVPLLPLIGVVILAASSLLRARLRVLVFAGVCAALSATCFSRARIQASEDVPALALTRWLPRAHSPAGLLVFAGEEARVLQHYLPAYRVVHAADERVLEREARRASALGVEVWVTSSASSPATLPQLLARPLARFEFPVEVRTQLAALEVRRYLPAARATPHIELALGRLP